MSLILVRINSNYVRELRLGLGYTPAQIDRPAYNISQRKIVSAHHFWKNSDVVCQILSKLAVLVETAACQICLVFVTVYSSAPVFVDVADELISEVSALKTQNSALETEVAALKAGSGKSLTLSTSYCTAFNSTCLIRFHTMILVLWPKRIVLRGRWKAGHVVCNAHNRM